MSQQMSLVIDGLTEGLGGFGLLKWINTISITVDSTFVSIMIFYAMVCLHKPIRELNVTAYCLLSPFIVR